MSADEFGGTLFLAACLGLCFAIGWAWDHRMAAAEWLWGRYVRARELARREWHLTRFHLASALYRAACAVMGDH